jgi:hypothetical protein
MDRVMEILYGLGFLALFSISAVAGAALRLRLPEEHLSNENMDAVRLMTGLLVTFAALVLSLQLSTATSAFDFAGKNRSIYAAELASLDQCLRNLGASMASTRLRLRQYTAAVIASTWPHEPAPSVEGMPDTSRMAIRGEDATLTELIGEIGLAIDSASPQDQAGANTAARCRAAYVTATQGRWGVIEDTRAPSRGLYTAIISLWLALVFLSFGLQIPRRRLTAIVLAIGVVSVASVMFVIVDLNLPYSGFFGIPSSAMRDALADMMR